jgi:hypothetical protein
MTKSSEKDFDAIKQVLVDGKLSSEEIGFIMDTIKGEYNHAPGPIREIAWAVLVESGHIGLAGKVIGFNPRQPARPWWWSPTSAVPAPSPPDVEKE